MYPEVWPPESLRKLRDRKANQGRANRLCVKGLKELALESTHTFARSWTHPMRVQPLLLPILALSFGFTLAACAGADLPRVDKPA